MRSQVDANSLFAGIDDMPDALDHDYEKERRYKEEQQEMSKRDVMEDISWDSVKQLPLPFQIHLGVALAICVLVFFIFHYTAKPTPQESVEWWLLPWFIFGMSLTGHFFFAKREYWKGMTIIVIIFHIGLFIINKTFTPEFDWYFYPLLGCAMAAVAGYYSQDKYTPILKIVTYEYIIVSIGCVLTWINLGNMWTKFPWFVYPVLSLGLILLVWNMWFVYQERRWFLYSGVVGTNVSLQCIFTWAFLGGAYNSWPWFVIVVGLFVGLTLALYVMVVGWFCCPLRDGQSTPTAAGEEGGGGAVVVERTDADTGSLTGALFRAGLDYMLRKK